MNCTLNASLIYWFKYEISLLPITSLFFPADFTNKTFSWLVYLPKLAHQSPMLSVEFSEILGNGGWLKIEDKLSKETVSIVNHCSFRLVPISFPYLLANLDMTQLSNEEVVIWPSADIEPSRIYICHSQDSESFSQPRT